MERTGGPVADRRGTARAERWQDEQLALGGRRRPRYAATPRCCSASREALEVEKKLITEMLPERTFVRPLLVVVPRPEA